MDHGGSAGIIADSSRTT